MPRGRVVTQSFDNPNKIALIDHYTRLTYAELRDFSSQIAKSLKLMGSCNKIISVYLDKSWQQIASILGILQAGSAYLPLSIDDPIERIKSVLDKAESSILITTENNKEKFSSLSHINLITVESLLKNTDLPHDTSIPQNNQDIAYVIFTSGSTGTPKGVVINHKSAVNTLLDINQKFQINSDDVVLGLSRLNFDLSVYDIFGTFAAGATLVLPRESELKDPLAWKDLVLKHKVTIWNSVPALMQLFLNYADSAKTTLRLILLSGDWISLTLPKQIQKIYQNQVKIISLGGATEGSIWSIYFPIESIDTAWKSIPYGTPLANQKIFILDSLLRQLPINTVGEICIGGVGVANGYLNESELTRKHFIHHPKYGRIYCTGDLGRLKSDGNIEILGRMDNQIKIHGLRIETAEIEYFLNRHQSILQSKIIAHDHGNSKQLVAFIKSNQPVTNENLKRYLSHYLPEHMIPIRYCSLNEYPLTSNGKIDQQALIKTLAKHDHIPSRISNSLISPEEHELQQIWQNLLGLNNPPDANDNFFALGGDSLMSLALAQELTARGYIYQNEFVFRYPTIKKLSSHLIKNYRMEASIVKNGDLSFSPSVSQLGLLTSSLIDSESNVYIEQVQWDTRGNIDLELYRKTWQKIFNRYETLRSRFTKIDGNIAIKFPVVEKTPFNYFDFSLEDNSVANKIQKLIQKDQSTAFDIFDSLLIRITLLKTDTDNFTTLFTFHHAILDGFSIAIIIKEFHDTYEALANLNDTAQSSTFPFSHYLQWIQDQVNSLDESFWRKYLSVSEISNHSPFYKAGKSYTSEKVINELSVSTLQLPNPLIKRLQLLAKENQITLISILQASWSYLLAYYLNQSKVTNGLIVFGRNIPLEISSAVGFFMNAVPIIVDVEPQLKFTEFARHCFDIASRLDAESFIGLSNIQIISQSRRPLFDHIIVFNQEMNLEKKYREFSISEPIIAEKTNYPLTVTFTLGKRSHVKFSFDTDYIDNKKVNIFKQHYLNILEYVSRHTDSILSDIDIFQHFETPLRIINTEPKEIVHQRNIYQEILSVENRSPNKSAIILSNGMNIPYSELIARVNSISCGLRSSAGPVVLWQERTFDMVISILACLKVGRPYITLPTNTPVKRIEIISLEVNSTLILTSDSLATMLDKNILHVITVNEISSCEKTIVEPAEIVYINFTSGTTGTPKAGKRQ